MDPEKAWERCRRHWAICPTCKRAGGEEADTSELCAEGRMLVRQWEAAERAHADRYARDHPGEFVL